jgi:hypothetical protein
MGDFESRISDRESEEGHGREARRSQERRKGEGGALGLSPDLASQPPGTHILNSESVG